MWVGYGITQPLRKHRRLGSLQLGKTSLDYSLYECYDIPSLLYSNIVARVSDALPLYISTSQYTYSTPLIILPTESCTLSALGTSSPLSTTDRPKVDRIAWWQRL